MSGRSGKPAFAAWAALVLIGGLFVIRFMAHWGYPWSDPAAWLLIAGSAGLGAVIGLAAFFGHRARMIVCFLGVLVLLTYSGVLLELSVSLTKLLQAPLSSFDIELRKIFLSSFAAVLVLSGLFLAVVFMTLKAQVPNLLFVVVLATGLATLVIPGHMDIKVKTAGLLPDRRADLPPFILIVMDGQLGIAGLPPGMPETRRARQQLLDTLTGFQIFENAYSRFVYTHLSLPAAFNFNQVGDPIAVEFTGFEPLGYRLEENKFIALLQQKNYAVKVVQTNYIDLCAGIADQCVTFPGNPFSRIADIGLSLRERLFVLIQRMANPILSSGLEDVFPLSAEPMVRHSIEEVERNAKGLAIILHILLPHEPYMLKSDCRPLAPNEWTDLKVRSRVTPYRDYLVQTVCAAKMLSQLFDALRAQNMWDDATIIVMGDHGSRMTTAGSQSAWRKKLSGAARLSEADKIDLFSALFAIKQPGGAAGAVNAPIEIQRAVAALMHGRSLPVDRENAGVGWLGPRLRTPFGVNFRRVQLPDSFQIHRR